MVDTINRYIWWWPKHLSPGEIEEMRKNMKKVPIIQLQSDIYHEKEVGNAEEVLWHITETETEKSTANTSQQESKHRSLWKKIIFWLQKLFTPRS